MLGAGNFLFLPWGGTHRTLRPEEISGRLHSVLVFTCHHNPHHFLFLAV